MGLLPKNAVLDGRLFFYETNLCKITGKKFQKIRGNKIAMIFQEPINSLNPSLTCGKQVAEILKYHTDLNKKEVIAPF